MSHDMPAYGHWGLVLVNSAAFVLFAFSFARPRTRRDWRSLGAFSAFLVALFTEMYGFPLTIYLLSGWLQKRFPGLDPLAHDSGHLWYSLFGLSGDPHSNPIHILSNVLVAGGFLLIAAAWRVLHAAQVEQRLAFTGPYAVVRHPQYIGFGLIMLGFLAQWPTLLTLLMFPVLVAMYVRLAGREERESRAVFGSQWDAYAARTPAFFPRLPGARDRQQPHEGGPAQ